MLRPAPKALQAALAIALAVTAPSCKKKPPPEPSPQPSAQPPKATPDDHLERCKAGNVDGCEAVGKLSPLQQRTLTYSAVRAALASGCDKGAATGCFALGQALYAGTFGDRDEKGALEAYARGCALSGKGASMACLSAAAIDLPRAQGREQQAAVLARYLRACEVHHDDEGCARVAFSQRWGYGVDEAPEQAARGLEKLCQSGRAAACAELGQMSLDGDGVPRDLDAAERRYKQACEGDISAACAVVGALEQRAVGRTPDIDAARASLERGCKKDNSEACYLLAELLERRGEGDAKRRKKAREKACEFLSPLGCELYARFGKQDAVPVEPWALARTACNAGIPESCFADLKKPSLVAPEDPHLPRGLEDDERLCLEQPRPGTAMPSAGSCARAGYLHEVGVKASGGKVSKTRADEARAKMLYQRGCRLGSTRACTRLGHLLVKGQGDAQARGKMLLERSCILRDPSACELR